MVCDGDSDINYAEQSLCKGGGFQLEKLFSKGGRRKDIRIVIENGCPLFGEEMHDGQGRKFPGIIHILFVR